MKNWDNLPINKKRLDRLYDHYNSPRWVHPDPLEFLYKYPELKDRELVALIASSFAYGRVAQILQSVSTILNKMGHSPYDFIKAESLKSLKSTFFGFKHRFTTDSELVLMLRGMKDVLDQYGSLYSCFLAGDGEDHDTILPALSFLVQKLTSHSDGSPNSLLPRPEKKSACKRLNLFLRWMVREDVVDPGGWKKVNPSKLLIPLDTHMHRIGLAFGFTNRKNGDMKTVLEITHAFREIEPLDPVRYDFALTRLGIRNDADLDSFLQEFHVTNPNAGRKNK